MSKLSDFLNFRNGKEIKKKLYSSNGVVKIYGANGLIGTTDNFLIDYHCIVVGRVGACGSVHLITDDYSWITDNAIIITVKENASLKYMYYLLKFLQLDKHKKGSVQPMITQSIIGEIEVDMPPLEEQEKIANLLSALDNKIELNNQMNKDLEELAQTLYTKWFINFDFPNEEGKPYKSSGGEMIDSELGEIPAGWRVGELGDLINKNKEKIKNKKDWENEKLIDLSNMPSYTMCLNESDLGKKLNSNIYKLNKYDILFGSIRPYLGKAGFAPFDGVVAGTIHSFIPKEKDFYSYVLCMTTRKLFFEYAIARSKGTKMPVVDYESICEYTCLIPSNEVIEQFNMIVFSYIKQISKNIEENQQLKETRDLLLPYLMSGKIDLGE